MNGIIKLFVANFPVTARECIFETWIKEFGDLHLLKMIYTGEGKARGFGFAIVPEGDAPKIIAGLNGQIRMGRKLFVAISKPVNHSKKAFTRAATIRE